MSEWTVRLYGPDPIDEEVRENVALGDERTLAIIDLARASLRTADIDTTAARLYKVSRGGRMERRYIGAVVRYADSHRNDDGYSYARASEERISAHAEHNAEGWHAYVNDLTDAPSYVDGNSTGICCHDCRLIIVDSEN